MVRFALFLAAGLAAAPALADTAGPARAEILPGWRGADGTHHAALHISLDPGWKTYWRAPGEAGLPPQFDWSGSDNLGSIKVMWPVPEVFASNGMTTIGYLNDVVLPLDIVPADPAADVMLDARLALGVCHDICMPMQSHVSARLRGAQADTDARIAIARDQRPDTAEEAGVVSAHCTVQPIADGMRVTATLDMPQVGPGEFAVVEGPSPDIWVSEAMTTRTANMFTATADLVPPTAKPFDLDPEDLRITVLAQGRAVDIQGCDSSP